MPKTAKQPAKAKDPTKRLRKLIKGSRVAMLTTVTPEGRLRSRPMMPGAVETNGDVWFLTKASSSKTDEIQDNQRVNVAYVAPKNDRYVSVSGVAALVRDPAKVKDLWQGRFKAWFPGGKKDPDLALLRVSVERAEYWDKAASRMVPLLEATRIPSRAGGANPASSGDDATGAGAQG